MNEGREKKSMVCLCMTTYVLCGIACGRVRAAHGREYVRVNRTDLHSGDKFTDVDATLFSVSQKSHISSFVSCVLNTHLHRTTGVF